MITPVRKFTVPTPVAPLPVVSDVKAPVARFVKVTAVASVGPVTPDGLVYVEEVVPLALINSDT